MGLRETLGEGDASGGRQLISEQMKVALSPEELVLLLGGIDLSQSERRRTGNRSGRANHLITGSASRFLSVALVCASAAPWGGPPWSRRRPDQEIAPDGADGKYRPPWPAGNRVSL